MSNDTQEAVEMGTKPWPEHAWLKNLVGEWRTESVMVMGPDQEPCTSHGTESVEDVGGLWAYAKGTATMPDGSPMAYYTTLGFDVSFKEYRGAWFATASSHLWKYVGELSADGKVMTLNCVGPNMVRDGETANYRDVIELVDSDHRTMTSYGQDDDGNWNQFMKVSYTRI